MNYFYSNENKSYLWSFMYSNGLFTNVSDKNVNEVKNDLDTCINNIMNTSNQNDSLTNLNKKVITQMIEITKKYKLTTTQELVRSQDLIEARKKTLQDKYNTMQNDFNEINKIHTPNEIDFSDEKDKPLGNELDILLSQTIAMRENELNIVLENNKAKDDNVNKINIGNSTKLDEIIDINEQKKNVTFSNDVSISNDTYNTTLTDNFLHNNFLSKLKSKSSSEKESNNSVDVLENVNFLESKMYKQIENTIIESNNKIEKNIHEKVNVIETNIYKRVDVLEDIVSSMNNKIDNLIGVTNFISKKLDRMIEYNITHKNIDDNSIKQNDNTNSIEYWNTDNDKETNE